MTAKNEDRYTVELRIDQWDLLVLALDRIRAMTTGDAQFTVDRLGREFLRRRCIETRDAIQAQVPTAAP